MRSKDLILGLVVLGVTASWAVQGCTCTQVACGDSHSFIVEFDQPIRSRYFATLTLDGRESSISCPIADGGTADLQGDFGGVVACSGLAIRVNLSDGLFEDEPDDLHVTLVDENGGQLADDDIGLDYSDFEPNGSFCGQSCDAVQTTELLDTTVPST